AGFRDVSIERMTVTFEFTSADAFADFRSAIGGTRAALAARTPEIRAQLRDAMMNSARAYAEADNVVRLNNETICFSARA
ncbi:MAG TPA: hypothetical protein VEO55_03550, partial [Candidatus Dormibacteraeota bacterium]|nr:hypothetical protein [Candidatus Dormibacteraeota bacterium]